MSTINVNAMTQAYNRMTTQQKATNKTEKSMVDTITDKLQTKNSETTGVLKSEAAGVIGPKDMTMEEYKQYINDKISSFPLNPSRMQDHIAVMISDAGYEAMKNDPEYESWVLDGIKYDFSVYNPWTSVAGGTYGYHYFGATKEEYRGQSWYAGYQNGNGANLYKAKTKNASWEYKPDQKKVQQQMIKKAGEKKRIQKQMDEKAALEEKLAHERMMREWRMQDFFKSDSVGNSSISGVGTAMSTPASAVAAYESNFMTM